MLGFERCWNGLFQASLWSALALGTTVEALHNQHQHGPHLGRVSATHSPQDDAGTTSHTSSGTTTHRSDKPQQGVDPTTLRQLHADANPFEATPSEERREMYTATEAVKDDGE